MRVAMYEHNSTTTGCLQGCDLLSESRQGCPVNRRKEGHDLTLRRRQLAGGGVGRAGGRPNTDPT